jgi:hypothetical protein
MTLSEQQELSTPANEAVRVLGECQVFVLQALAVSVQHGL